MAVRRRAHSPTLPNYSKPKPTLFISQNPQHHTQHPCLRKSIFNPIQGQAEAYATRRHLAGADAPRISIVHYSPRWLLLEAPHTKANYFEKLNGGKLGCKEQQILKLFKSFIVLVRNFGLFRPTEGMVFLEKVEVRVWINEDIFSNVPMMPIAGGLEGEKHFVIAFLAMVETYLDNWERVLNISTISDTLKMLEWRCKLAKGNPTAVFASQEVNYNPEASTASIEHSQINSQINPSNLIMTSQQLSGSSALSSFMSDLSCSVAFHENKCKQVKEITFMKKKTETREQENDIRSSKKKFALNSTTSTIGAFSQKFRTTAGRKKLMERVEAQQCTSQQHPKQPVLVVPCQPAHIPNIQMEFDGLFEEEINDGFDEEELERITEEIEEVLF